MWKASRAGSTSSFGARWMTILPSASSQCCAPRKTKFTGKASASPEELAEGFPSKPEDLFEYDGIILGSVEEAFFTPGQAQAIKDFVDRRGGGLLFLAGRWSLADGGYNVAPFSRFVAGATAATKRHFPAEFRSSRTNRCGPAESCYAGLKMMRRRATGIGRFCRISRIIKIRERLSLERWC